MNGRISTFFNACALTWICIYSTQIQADMERKELLLGSVAMDIPAVMHKRLLPLTNYLSKTLGRPVSLKLSPNMGTAIQELAQGSVDIAYLTPVAYLKAHELGNAQLVVKTVTKGMGSFKLMIVVKDTSPIMSIRDLEGKSFAFGDERALLQRAAVVGSGLALEKLASYQFIGHYDNIVRAVISGDFDAGILKDTMAYKWEGNGIRIIYSTDDLPPYNFSASKNVDKELLAKLQRAFLTLNAENSEQLQIIQSVDKTYSGFAVTSDTEYDIIRRLIKPFN